MPKLINTETATEEIEKWLNFKHISEKKRQANKENIEALVDAICEGVLIIKEDFTIVQKLFCPLENEMPVHNLDYKPRLKIKEVSAQMEKVRAGDALGMITSYIAALTGQPRAVIQNLETEDYGVASSIAVFFL